MSPWAHCWRQRENAPTFQFAETEHSRSSGHRETKKTQLEKEATQMARVVEDSSAALRVLRATYGFETLTRTCAVRRPHSSSASEWYRCHCREDKPFLDDNVYRSFHILRSDAQGSERGNRDSAMCVSFGGQSDRGAPYRAHNSRADAGPEARASDIFQSFVVGATLVKQHDGQALAADNRDSLEKVGVVTTEKTYAIAADWQYYRRCRVSEITSVGMKSTTNMRHLHLKSAAL